MSSFAFPALPWVKRPWCYFYRWENSFHRGDRRRGGWSRNSMQIACLQKCFHSTKGPKLLKKKKKKIKTNKHLHYSFWEDIIIIPRKCKAHIRFVWPNLIDHPGVRYREAESRDVSFPESLTRKSRTTLLDMTAVLKLCPWRTTVKRGPVWASGVSVWSQAAQA